MGTIKISFGSVQNDMPCIGDVVSTQCEIQITAIPDGQSLEGKQFQLYFYLVDPMYGMLPAQNTLEDFAEYTLAELAESDKTLAEMSVPKMRYEEIPIAKLTVLKCKKLSDYYTLTCSDRLHFADSDYISNLDYPTTSDKVIAEIAQQIGLASEVEPAQTYLVSRNNFRLLSSNGSRLITSTWQFDILEKPKDFTKRQVIGYIAAMRGKFAVIDRTGTLVQRWYNNGSDIYFTPGSDTNDRHFDDYEISETPVEFGYLTCKVSNDNTLSCGNQLARRMEMTCPYMTQSRLGELYPQACMNVYYPCDLTQRLGDPRYDLWDSVYDSDGRRLLMLNMDYTFDGGLMLDITSGGDSDTESQATGTY